MANVNLGALIRDKVKTLKAYHVESFDCEIKLHANENPFAPPPEILQAFQEKLGKLALNRYPDPDCGGLKKAIAQNLNQPPERLVIGNGSDELIQILLQIFCDAGDAVAFPDPTFAMYALIAQGMGLQPVGYPLNDQWDFEASRFLDTISPRQPKIIFLSYPNNPTGNCFSADEIQKVIEQFPGIVVVDEAYYDFSRKTFLPELESHNNLIILRSLSKIGLAALRVGYGVMDPEIIHEVNKVRLPYNANTLSQEFSEVVLNNFDPVRRQIDLILKERDGLLSALGALPGVTPYPSDSNFILFKVDAPSKELFQRLIEAGILIRDLSSHPRLKNCLRVTVGKAEENTRFRDALRGVFSQV